MAVVRRWPWVAAGAAALLVVGASVGLGARVGLERLSYVAAIVALWPLLAGLYTWARKRSQASTSSTPAQLDAAAGMLARWVEREWRVELEIEQLLERDLLAVRW